MLRNKIENQFFNQLDLGPGVWCLFTGVATQLTNEFIVEITCDDDLSFSW